MIKLKAVSGPADLEVVKQLSHEIWHEYYPAIVTTVQIDYMLHKFHTVAAMLQQMEAGQNFYLILENDTPIGYCSFSAKEGKAFLHKFYLLAAKRGGGVGSAAFNSLQQLMHGNKSVSLQVNRKNYKSINFYFKNGFTIEYVKDFDIGNGYLMEDFVMTKMLTP
jgi:diamine N-acetyltransferase